MNDNGGAFYTFTTRRAPQPPWFDDLENGIGDWTVIADPAFGSDMNWTLGTPDNGLETSAYSGTNAWGSNLEGQPFGFLASSFLYSPEIDLSGLGQATLTFWHSFDFSSGLENGQLGISTNSSTSPNDIPTLMSFADMSDGWEQETVDLTPYVGKTIQIVWYYQGVYIGTPLHGWLVDDVSITGVTAADAGTITISKNLGQGTFNLTGPMNRSGSAASTTISNAQPGQYTIRFSDVTFYQTPASQTNTLAASGTLSFNGNYVFIDANHNGISDSWENYYFRLGDRQSDAIHRHGRRRDAGLRRVYHWHQPDQCSFQIRFPLRVRPDQSIRSIEVGGHSRPLVSTGRFDQLGQLDAAHHLAAGDSQPNVIFGN